MEELTWELWKDNKASVIGSPTQPFELLSYNGQCSVLTESHCDQQCCRTMGSAQCSRKVIVTNSAVAQWAVLSAHGKSL
ncbi:hypothetical protein RRG08_028508 [Elysia crispata]|uniref:Uncharacterized protein n=1 Tax=Elysia crispata TaxID=231223 RepID=A0AAE0ZJC5_9GAST|nr:hypothetical protein RRG08_028508 [Elysia crispata]